MKSNASSLRIETCADARGLVDGYVSGELPSEALRAIELHCERCPECTEIIEARSRVRQRLREAVLGQELPSGLRGRVLEAIRSEPAPRRVIPLWSTSRLAWGMAASLVIAVGLAALLRDGGANAMTAELQRSRAHVVQVLNIGFDNHVNCTLAHDLAGQQADDTAIVKELGSQYADLLPYVRDRIQGFTVAVGHRCSVHGRSFIHMVLRRGPDFISLAITPRATETLAGDTAASIQSVEGVRLYMERMSHGRPYEIAAFETPSHIVFVSTTASHREIVTVTAALAPGMNEVLS